jgi:hypothetical protein
MLPWFSLPVSVRLSWQKDFCFECGGLTPLCPLSFAAPDGDLESRPDKAPPGRRTP